MQTCIRGAQWCLRRPTQRRLSTRQGGAVRLVAASENWREYFADDGPSASERFFEDIEEASTSGERFSSLHFSDGVLQRRAGSSWSSKEKGSEDRDDDYLYDIGAKQLYNINVDHGVSASSGAPHRARHLRHTPTPPIVFICRNVVGLAGSRGKEAWVRNELWLGRCKCKWFICFFRPWAPILMLRTFPAS